MKVTFYLVAALLITAMLLPAEEKGKKKGEEEDLQYHLVVTATRTEESRSETASTTTVITAEELKKSGKRNMVEALAAVPGLDVAQSGGVGNPTQVFIRGANSEHTLVMIDGVEVNDPIAPGRSFNFAHMNLDNIDRIEIVRGPQSTLYGSDAMGGVINIITARGEGKPTFALSAEGGSYGSFRESADINGGNEKLGYSLGVSRFDTKGFSAAAASYGNTEKDSYGNTSLNARLDFKPLKNMDINVLARYIDASGDIDNFGGAFGDDPNHTFDSKHLILALNTGLELLQGKWQQRLGISYNRQHRNDVNPVDELSPFDSSDGTYKGATFKVDWQHNFYVHPTQTLTAGLEYQDETGESENNWGSQWGFGHSLFPGQKASNVGFYFQDNLKLWDTLFMTLGARYDNHSRFGSHFTYRIAPVLVLKRGTRIKGSYGTGFKAPSLYQLYAPGTLWGPIGNENLDAEKSKGWDLGIEQFLFNSRLNFGLTYFGNNFEGLIQYDWALGYVNVDQAETSGVEAFISVLPVAGLTVKGSYTYTRARDKETGEMLLRRPEHKANLFLNYRFLGKAGAHLELLYVGKRLDVFPFPTIVEADPYTLVNMGISYSLTPNIRVFGRVLNLFNEVYEALLGYGTPGRSFYMGFSLDY